MERLDSSGEIPTPNLGNSIDNNPTLGESIEDDFLRDNPALKESLLKLKQEVGIISPDWEVLLTEPEDEDQMNQLTRLREEELASKETRGELIKTIEELFRTKSLLQAEFETRTSLHTAQAEAIKTETQLFSNSHRFKFLTKVSNPLPSQEANMDSKQRELENLLTLLTQEFSKRISSEQLRHQDLQKQLESLEKSKHQKKESPHTKILITCDEDIQSKEDYLKKLKDKNLRLQQKLRA